MFIFALEPIKTVGEQKGGNKPEKAPRRGSYAHKVC
jgi:hypothetical protein